MKSKVSNAPIDFDPFLEDESVDSQTYKQAWSRLLAKVYEVDPFVYPKCGSEMKVIAVIQEPDEIKRILRHLVKNGRSTPQARSCLSKRVFVFSRIAQQAVYALCPARSGRFEFILRESTGLRGCGAQQGVLVPSRTEILAGFRLQV